MGAIGTYLSERNAASGEQKLLGFCRTVPIDLPGTFFFSLLCPSLGHRCSKAHARLIQGNCIICKVVAISGALICTSNSLPIDKEHRSPSSIFAFPSTSCRSGPIMTGAEIQVGEIGPTLHSTPMDGAVGLTYPVSLLQCWGKFP